MLKKLAILALSPIFLTSTALAQTIVDLELLLAVDVSGSVDNDEFDLQRTGYTDAFNNESIIDAIINSPKGIAVGLTYWASDDNVLEIPWKHLQTTNDIATFANTIENTPRPAFTNRSGTSINRTIKSSIDGFSNSNNSSFSENGFDSINLILDISGDGKSTDNNGILTRQERDRAEEEGITINGLAIENENPSDPTEVTKFYRDNVIIGTNSFVETATDFEDFGGAIERKLEREIVTNLIEPTPNPEPTSTPEPISLISLLSLGIFGGVAKFKKKSTKLHSR